MIQVTSPLVNCGHRFGNTPRVKHTNVHDHITHELSTHIEHPLCRNQHDMTLMMQRSDVDETRGDQRFDSGHKQ